MPELPLTMPKMSMTMEEGTMVSWLKSEGDSIKSGEPVCEVATDKVDMEVESPFDGILARITAFPDDVVKVGDPIAYVTTDADDLLGGLFDEPMPANAADGSHGGVEAVNSVAGGSQAEAVPDSGGNEWVPAVPLARAIAKQRGIDLHAVVPSGRWGSVRVSDVEAADRGSSAESHGASFVPSVTVDAAEGRRRRTRLLVARVMSASAAVPQFTAYRELDLVSLSQVRKSTLAGASWTTILVKAQAMALRRHPPLNGFWADGGVEPSEQIGVALAIDSPSGLLAPVLRNPDHVTLSELGDEIRSIIEAARIGAIRAEQLQGGSTVFSNLGGMGVDSFNALLTPPHATALSAGAIRERVVVRDDGAFGPRLTCTVGLTLDHRVADGADAARFLATLAEIIADPTSLISS